MRPALRRWGEAGPEVLALHCSLASSTAWGGVAAQIEGRARLTAPDLIGHGRAADWDSARPYAEQALEAIAAHIPSELEPEPGPVHLVGHSFGGVLALALALGRPEAVRSLTLIEPVLFCAASGPGREAADAVLDGMEGHLRRGNLEAAAEIFLGLWGGGQPFESLPQAQQNYSAARMPLIAAQQRVLFEDSQYLLSRLGTCTMPVLLLEGAESPPVIGEILDRLQTDLLRVRREVIEGAGHMAPISHPEAVARAIASQLA